ncbi:MAG TPA: transglycosylase SLT domain-containing protein [Candidatus Nanoarchaeia archaeon]|nr:transglycosylase SLT domain-containing protein [Candidatus Nanoarchaeia archaeon]
MNRKCAVLMYPVLAGFIVALATYYILDIQEGLQLGERQIGELQMEALAAVQEGEKLLLYVDTAAALASREGIVELAKGGGFALPSCGSSAGFAIWDAGCIPDVRAELGTLIQRNLHRYLSRVSLFDEHQYLFIPGERLEIIGAASREALMTREIGRAVRERPVPQAPAPAGIQEVFERYIRQNDSLWLFVREEAARADADPYVVLGIITAESGWNPNALRCEESLERRWEQIAGTLQCSQYACEAAINSPQGTFHQVSCSYGYMQLLYGTAWDEGYRGDAAGLFDAQTNIRHGIAHIARRLQQFGNVEDALAAYNAGPASVLRAQERCGRSFADYAGCLPFPGITGNYVPKVLAAAERFRELEEGLPEVTGTATLERKMTLRYAVRPSFRVAVDYDLGQYDAVEAGISLIQQACGNAQDAAACVAEQSAALGWEQDCADADERALRDFLVFAEQCAASIGEGCGCTLAGDYGEEEYVFSPEGDGSYTVHGLRAALPLAGQVIRYATDGQEMTLVTERDGRQESSTGNALTLVKENGMLRIAEGSTPIPQCRLLPERTFRLCVPGKKEIFAGGGMQRPDIRVALRIPDVTAPAPVAARVHDVEEAENQLLLSWDAGAEQDISEYRVYYARALFSEISKGLSNPANLSAGQGRQLVISPLEGYAHDLEQQAYYVAVVAVDAYGNALMSVTPAAVTEVDDLPPDQVANLQAEKAGSSVTLRWLIPLPSRSRISGIRILVNNLGSGITTTINEGLIEEYTVPHLAAGEHLFQVALTDGTQAGEFSWVQVSVGQ